jgi:hypothetical protein
LDRNKIKKLKTEEKLRNKKKEINSIKIVTGKRMIIELIENKLYTFTLVFILKNYKFFILEKK